MPANWLFWVLFHVFVFAMLTLDLGVFHRKVRVIPFREAAAWTAMWIALAAIFALLIYFFGHAMTGRLHRATRVLSLEFITGYVVEEALSVDNLFVFLLLFRYFGVPGEYQHKVLFWGILGALVLRGTMIGLGTALIRKFEWALYVLAAFLVVTAIRMLLRKETEPHPERSRLLRW